MLPGIDVSVVIPTRNRPDLLLRSVESALRQKSVALEVVVVMDGEDDVSEALLRNFDDARVRWVHLASPVGGAEARNVGVRHARGRFIALLDDDDEWMAGKIERQLAIASKQSHDAFVVTTQYVYRRDGQPDEVWPGHLPKKGEELSEFLFSSAGGFQTSTYLCPRELFLRMPFEPGLKRHQDWDWFLKLKDLPGFQLLVVTEPMSVYWVPAGRKSISGDVDWRYSLEWAERVRKRMTDRAYAAFVVRICLRGALLSDEPATTIVSLLWRLLKSGGLTPVLVLHVLAGVTISEAMRAGLRKKVCGWKQRLTAREWALHMQEGR